MRLVSPLLKHVIYPGLGKARYLRGPKDGCPAVLTYHGVLPSGYSRREPAIDGHLVTADELRAQLKLLASRYNVVSPEEFRLWVSGAQALPARSVLLTCDDGLRNTLTDMLPVIREFEVPFLFFLTSGSASENRAMLWHERLYLLLNYFPQKICLRMPSGAEPFIAETPAQRISLWQRLIRELSPLSVSSRTDAMEDLRIQIGIGEEWLSEYSQNESFCRRFFMLNRADLNPLAEAGITFGAHTVSHGMLSTMQAEQALDEISENRAHLESALGREVWALAYPFGMAEAATAREAVLAASAGFSCAFMNTKLADRSGNFDLPRIHVSHGMSLAELEARLCGLHQWLQRKYSALHARGNA